jgi:hypothetical protein
MKMLQHLSAIAIITVVMGLIYASVQQTYRSNANDPQIQIVHDLKDQMEKGQSVESAFTDTVDLEKSLAIFLETYDAQGRPIRSTGYLNKSLPQLPKGVIDYVGTRGEHWVTWQPRPNVRMATGILRVNAAPVSYIVVGRSLREVEERVSRLTMMVFIGWVLCVSVVIVNWLVHYFQYKKINPNKEPI